jgi:membrane fusion protein (multidrug efflux system)
MKTEPSSAAATETPAQAPAPPAPAPPAKKRRWSLLIVILLALAAIVFALPRIVRAFGTVSTDDAYVNSYVTFVAPRVSGQVLRLGVEDNNRVPKGAILLELDPEPYRVMVEIKQAALQAAQADLTATEATVRGSVAQARGMRFKLQRTIEDVDNQVALIRSRAATLDQAKASLGLAQSEFERAERLHATKVVSAEELDQRRAQLEVAKAQVAQALESVLQARVALGLPAQPPEGKPLTDVPADLGQTFSAVREALAALLQSAAVLGIVPSSYDLKPREVLEEFLRRDAGGDIDKIYAKVIQDAPALKQANAAVLRAQRDVEQANLDLGYCTVRAEIEGVVTRRNVNPGNTVQVGQNLMALRSLTDVWVDANFKETQLRDLRIGQRVELEVDMYGRKQRFDGRISGFTIGTGATLSLLPPQNATGNFVKVVQRLPVRVDVLNYDPDKLPLFTGLSVTPRVDLRSPPSGPNAGRFLQEPTTPAVK